MSLSAQGLMDNWEVLTLCSIKDINTNCLKQFTAHWECLENNNHNLWECRRPEMQLNNCVFEKLVRSAITMFSRSLLTPCRVSRRISPVLRRTRLPYISGLSSCMLNTPVLSTRMNCITFFLLGFFFLVLGTLCLCIY